MGQYYPIGAKKKKRTEHATWTWRDKQLGRYGDIITQTGNSEKRLFGFEYANKKSQPELDI